MRCPNHSSLYHLLSLFGAESSLLSVYMRLACLEIVFWIRGFVLFCFFSVRSVQVMYLAHFMMIVQEN